MYIFVYLYICLFVGRLIGLFVAWLVMKMMNEWLKIRMLMIGMSSKKRKKRSSMYTNNKQTNKHTSIHTCMPEWMRTGRQQHGGEGLDYMIIHTYIINSDNCCIPFLGGFWSNKNKNWWKVNFIILWRCFLLYK